MNVDYQNIIQKYYVQDSKLYKILITHSELVRDKALYIARKNSNLNPDLKFIEEASMLHDIGMFLCDAPSIECQGTNPYICHGYLGREILEKEGLPNHALVCERHTGTGLHQEDIIEQNLPIPKRDMLPTSLEEEIICFADKFFSKKSENEKTLIEIKEELRKFGEDRVEKIEKWEKKYL